MAEDQALLDQVRHVMARAFGVPPDEIRGDTTADEIERWDSLSMVIVAIGLERRLKRPIDPSQIVRVRSVADLLTMLRQ